MNGTENRPRTGKVPVVWDDGILAKKVLFRKVLPILWQHLSFGDILNCRLVCHAWRQGVDDCRHFVPCWKWYVDYTPQGSEQIADIKYDNFYLRKCSPEFYSLQFNPSLARRVECRLQIGHFSNPNPAGCGGMVLVSGWRWYRCFYRKTKVEYLLVPFTTFPKLSSLHLHFHNFHEHTFNKVVVNQGRLEELEAEALEVVAQLKRESNNKIRLGSLTQLEVEIGNRYDYEVINELDIFPLARLICALVSSAPRLEKVVLYLGLLYKNKEQIEELSRVLCAVAARSSTVKDLTLEGWKSHLVLSELGPPSGRQWPLKSLRIDLALAESEGGGEGALNTLRRTLFDILDRFGRSLEELKVVPIGLGCGDRAGEPAKLERRCICNCKYYWDNRSTGTGVEKVPEMCSRSGGDDDNAISISVPKKVFEKLKLLSIPHALLHPVIFPAVMKATPAISTLQVNDLGFRYWIGMESPESVQLVHGLVSGLWAEAPPTLKLIEVDEWRGEGGNDKWKGYKVSRSRMFEAPVVSPLHLAQQSSSSSGSWGKGGVEIQKGKGNNKCVLC